MSVKCVPLSEPMIQDMVRGYSLKVRILPQFLIAMLFGLLCQGIYYLQGGQDLMIGKPINMFWTSMSEPMLFGRHEEDPFEPFVQGQQITPPADSPEQEEDFNLWPRQTPAKIRQPEQEGSFNLFPRRDPFKDIREEAELPTGRYVSQSFVTHSQVGPDGKIMTQRYASSAAGNGKENIHEAKHLYFNSTSGLEKASHEQHLRGRARMAVSESGNGHQGSSNQFFHGMNVTDNAAFGQEFETNAKHLPARVKLSRDALEAPSNNFHKFGPALGYHSHPVARLLGRGVW